MLLESRSMVVLSKLLDRDAKYGSWISIGMCIHKGQYGHISLSGITIYVVWMLIEQREEASSSSDCKAVPLYEIKSLRQMNKHEWQWKPFKGEPGLVQFCSGCNPPLNGSF